MNPALLAIIVFLVIIFIAFLIWAFFYFNRRPPVVPLLPRVSPSHPELLFLEVEDLRVTNSADIRKLNMTKSNVTVSTVTGQETVPVVVTEKQGMITINFTTPLPPPMANGTVLTQQFFISHPDIDISSCLLYT